MGEGKCGGVVFGGGGGGGRAQELSTWAHKNEISPNYREIMREIVTLTSANDNYFSIHF